VHVLYQREGNRKGATSSSEQEAPKTPDPKVDNYNKFSLVLHLLFFQVGCRFGFNIIKAELVCGFETVCTDTEKTCSE